MKKKFNLSILCIIITLSTLITMPIIISSGLENSIENYPETNQDIRSSKSISHLNSENMDESDITLQDAIHNDYIVYNTGDTYYYQIIKGNITNYEGSLLNKGDIFKMIIKSSFHAPTDDKYDYMQVQFEFKEGIPTEKSDEFSVSKINSYYSYFFIPLLNKENRDGINGKISEQYPNYSINIENTSYNYDKTSGQLKSLVNDKVEIREYYQHNNTKLLDPVSRFIFNTAKNYSIVMHNASRSPFDIEIGRKITIDTSNFVNFDMLGLDFNIRMGIIINTYDNILEVEIYSQVIDNIISNSLFNLLKDKISEKNSLLDISTDVKTYFRFIGRLRFQIDLETNLTRFPNFSFDFDFKVIFTINTIELIADLMSGGAYTAFKIMNRLIKSVIRKQLDLLETKFTFFVKISMGFFNDISSFRLLAGFDYIPYKVSVPNFIKGIASKFDKDSELESYYEISLEGEILIKYYNNEWFAVLSLQSSLRYVLSDDMANVLNFLSPNRPFLGGAGNLFHEQLIFQKDGVKEITDSSNDKVKIDTDGDFISDVKEIEIGTDPNINDTDSDGVLDGIELRYDSSPLLDDTDGDGLTDYEEIKLGSAPNLVDTDGDGLNDSEEVQIYKTNPLHEDTDGDGLTDFYEINIGTYPNNTDSDMDSYSDYSELNYYDTDPLNYSDIPKDSDKDKLPDIDEINVFKSDPDNSFSNPSGNEFNDTEYYIYLKGRNFTNNLSSIENSTTVQTPISHYFIILSLIILSLFKKKKNYIKINLM